MGQLSRKYGEEAMRTIRASRVDYYTQHDPTIWKDNFLSLGLEGEDCVFVNLAAVAGPKVRNTRHTPTHTRVISLIHDASSPLSVGGYQRCDDGRELQGPGSCRAGRN